MFQIIYEDKNILVVNKPAGISVHPDNTHKTGTLIQEIFKNHPEIKNVGEDPVRPGIVHRLDKDTSGVLIVAKNQATFEYLKNQFQNHKIKKTYLALVSGKLKNKEGTIDLPIGRSRKSPVQRLASPKARGKLREAITEYKVLEVFVKSRAFDTYSLVEVYPKTGRTHQIRVHFKAIGHPVVCDKLYSKNSCLPSLSRQFLHASSLELTLPDGSRNRFEASLPDDLEKALKQLRENGKYDSNNR